MNPEWPDLWYQHLSMLMLKKTKVPVVTVLVPGSTKLVPVARIAPRLLLSGCSMQRLKHCGLLKQDSDHFCFIIVVPRCTDGDLHTNRKCTGCTKTADMIQAFRKMRNREIVFDLKSEITR